jgi:hypothetical protein
MLRTIVGDLLRQEPDMLIVAHPGGSQDAIRSAHEESADILITQEGADDPDSCLETILGSDGLAICALSADGRSASAMNLVRRPIAFDDDRFVLADAVRGIAEGLRADRAGTDPFGRNVARTGDRQ